jgi:hypothetical protein
MMRMGLKLSALVGGGGAVGILAASGVEGAGLRRFVVNAGYNPCRVNG